MPKPGTNSTYHLKEKPWEFWQYPFSPNVLLAERKINWYDIQRFREIKSFMRTKGAKFFWNDPVDEENHKKHNGAIEIYKRFPEDTSFENKVKEMYRIIASVRDI